MNPQMYITFAQLESQNRTNFIEIGNAIAYDNKIEWELPLLKDKDFELLGKHFCLRGIVDNDYCIYFPLLERYIFAEGNSAVIIKPNSWEAPFLLTKLDKPPMIVSCPIENLNCPECELPHEDIDEWALKPHKTHLCLHCGTLFEGTKHAVSRPRLTWRNTNA